MIITQLDFNLNFSSRPAENASFYDGVPFASDAQTVVVKGITKIPSPLLGDHNTKFTFDQIIGGETQIIRRGNFVTTSMIIDGELAPAYSVAQAEIFAAGAELALKITAMCDQLPLDNQGTCDGLSVSDLKVGISTYNNDEITPELLENSFGISKYPSSSSNEGFELTYSAASLGLTSTELEAQDFLLVIKNGDSGASYRYSILRNSSEPSTPPTPTLGTVIQYGWPANENGFVSSTHYVVKAKGANGTKTMTAIFNEPNTTGVNNGQVYSTYLTAKGSKIKVASNSIVSFATEENSTIEIEARVTDSVCNNVSAGRVSAVNIQPKSYGITPHFISADMRTVKFYLTNKDDRANYITVDFQCDQNKISSHSTIAHSLIVLLDTPETMSPTLCEAPNSVYVCTNKDDRNNCKSADADLAAYDNLCFKGGKVTDLRSVYSIDRPYVKLNSTRKQNVFLEPGAYVVGGLFNHNGQKASNNFLQGRGAFDGSLIPMKQVFHPDNAGKTLSLINADFSSSRIEGIMTMNPYYHTASLGSHVHLKRVKTFGFAANHDSFRNWVGGSVDRAFVRVADDAQYVRGGFKQIRVVTWPMHNGSQGWTGEGENTQNGMPVFEENYYINSDNIAGLNHHALLAGFCNLSATKGPRFDKGMRWKDIYIDKPLHSIFWMGVDPHSPSHNNSMYDTGSNYKDEYGYKDIEFKNMIITGWSGEDATDKAPNHVSKTVTREKKGMLRGIKYFGKEQKYLYDSGGFGEPQGYFWHKKDTQWGQDYGLPSRGGCFGGAAKPACIAIKKSNNEIRAIYHHHSDAGLTRYKILNSDHADYQIIDQIMSKVSNKGNNKVVTGNKGIKNLSQIEAYKIVDLLLKNMPTNDAGDDKFVKVENVRLDTVIINGVLLTKDNYPQYMDIDTEEQGAGSVRGLQFLQTSTLRDVNVSSQGQGSVFPNGKNGVAKCIVGMNCSFQAYPDPGYKVKDLRVDKGSGFVSMGALSTWSFQKVEAAGIRKVQWEFEPL